AFYASEDASVVGALQQELERAGCNPGGVDGKWGANSRSALERYARAAGLDVGSGAPTAYMLMAVRAAGATCGGQSSAPAPEPQAPQATATAALDPSAPDPAPAPTFR